MADGQAAELENLNESMESINRNLMGLASEQEIDTDRSLQNSDNQSLSVHNAQYSRLLELYVNNYEAISVEKNENKKEIYTVSKWMLILVPIVSFVLILLSLIAVWTGVDTAAIIPELLVTMGTVIGTYFTILKIITKYLFNKKEEETMASIISAIQTYDSSIRDNKHKNAS